MPQNPIGFGVQSGGGTAQGPFQGDSAVALSKTPGIAVAGISGTSSVLNITAPTVIKALPGRLTRLSVIVAGSTAGTANDCTTTAAAAAGNQFMSVPNTVGTYSVEWPCASGIVVVPGTGQTLSVAYS